MTRPDCFYRCGRQARAKGRCAVCYEYERREKAGQRCVALELLRANLEIARLRGVLEQIADLDGGRYGDYALLVAAQAWSRQALA